MLRAANEQVVGKRVLEKMCTQFSEAGGSGRQAKGKKGLGWALKDGWTLERSQEAEGSCRLKIHALAIHPPPVISQSTITGLKIQAGEKGGTWMEFRVRMSNASCQDTGESSSQPSGIIIMVAIKPMCWH